MAHASPQPRLISPAQIVANLTYEDLIPAIEQGLGNFSLRNEDGGGRGGVFPQRTMMNIEEHNGALFIMPVFSSVDHAIATKIVASYPNNAENNIPTHSGTIILTDAKPDHVFVMPVFSSADNIIATKIVAIFPDNTKKKLSSHLGTIILNDGTTGIPRAIMDAEHITAMRTAAASAVATKYLAKDGWQKLTLVGAGAQAEAHLNAFRHIFTINEVQVWTRSFEKCQAFAQKFHAKAYETAKEAVAGADVIITCTFSETPVLESSWLKLGAHINCVGACKPWSQELGPEVMKKAVVYTDNTPGAYKESGDVIHSQVTVYAEIGEVINGTKEAKRDEITVFKSQGVAIEDAIAAKLVYDKVSLLSDNQS